MAQVVVYHQPSCRPCRAAMDFLSHQGVPFTAKDVSSDPEARQELIALGSRATPTITVDGQVLIGFDPTKLAAVLRTAKATADAT